MIEAMKISVLLQRALTRDPAVLSGYDALRMATIDAAKAIGMDDKIGSLEKGKCADIVIIDFQRFRTAPSYDPVNTLVFSSDANVVDTVIIDGNVVLENGNFTTIDENAFLQMVQKAGSALVQRALSPSVLEKATVLKPTSQ